MYLWTFLSIYPIGLSHLLFALVLVTSGCADLEEGAPIDRDQIPEGMPRELIEPVSFTDQPYQFSGDTPIAEVRNLIPADEFVWTGFAPNDPYAVSVDCEPDRRGFQGPVEVPELPAVIEGVVTLHPRWFQRVAICGQDERNYGAYILQDQSQGIVVLKNSRVADFTFGDKIRLRVRGLIKFFDTYAVVATDELGVLERNVPIYYQELKDREFQDSDIGRVYRVTGRVVREPTNVNFNEMEIESLENPSITWMASMDRELQLRNVQFERGEIVQLTGPVVNSFGLRLLFARLGQVERFEDPQDPSEDSTRQLDPDALADQ